MERIWDIGITGMGLTGNRTTGYQPVGQRLDETNPPQGGSGVSIRAIDKIESIRTRNNKNWMDLLRLALKYTPRDELRPILQGIIDHDIEVTCAMKSLLEELR